MLKQNVNTKNTRDKNPDCHASKDGKGKNVIADKMPIVTRKPAK